MNQVLQMMLNQKKKKNPQMFQMIELARQNQNNPMEIFKQVTQKYSPQQMEQLYANARKFGIPEIMIKSRRPLSSISST